MKLETTKIKFRGPCKEVTKIAYMVPGVNAMPSVHPLTIAGSRRSGVPVDPARVTMHNYDLTRGRTIISRSRSRTARSRER